MPGSQTHQALGERQTTTCSEAGSRKMEPTGSPRPQAQVDEHLIQSNQRMLLLRLCPERSKGSQSLMANRLHTRAKKPSPHRLV